MESLFCNYGIEILKKDGKYYIRFDSGELVSAMKKIEVTEKDASLAQRDEKTAYHILLNYVD